MIFACETDGFVEKSVFSTKVGLFWALICQDRPKGAFLRKCGLVWQLWKSHLFLHFKAKREGVKYSCDQCYHEATKNESSGETFQIKALFMDDHVSVQL